MNSPLRLSLCIVAVSVLAPASAEASNYPPSYDVCGVDDYAYSGPFEVIRDVVDLRDHVKLTFAYRGYLRDLYPDEDINIYVRINGHDAFLGASAGSFDDAYVQIDSGPRDCVWCSSNPNQNPAACDDVVLPEFSSGQWVCEDPSPVEAHLFYWAFDAWGNPNAMDIELAAEANGQWDSNWGANFSTRLEPRTWCS